MTFQEKSTGLRVCIGDTSPAFTRYRIDTDVLSIARPRSPDGKTRRADSVLM